MKTLSLDLETYSSVDLGKSSVYRYAESPDFDILLLGYCADGGEVQVVDLAQGEQIPTEVIDALTDECVCKWAFNAQFERVCLSQWLRRNGYPLRNERYAAPDDPCMAYLNPAGWHCTMVWSAYLGLPLSLKDVGAALGLDKQKLTEGKELIRYFCVPGKDGTRHMPASAPEKWATFRAYNLRDVETEMSIQERLGKYPVPEEVWSQYHLDQQINDRGIGVDRTLVRGAIGIDKRSREELTAQLQELTMLDNPNSVQQMKDWLAANGLQTDTLGKKQVAELLKTAPEPLKSVLVLRQQMAKSSVKKYQAMENAVCADGRVRGCFQFYGARTGRWAGRNIPTSPRRCVSCAGVPVCDSCTICGTRWWDTPSRSAVCAMASCPAMSWVPLSVSVKPGTGPGADRPLSTGNGHPVGNLLTALAGRRKCVAARPASSDRTPTGSMPCGTVDAGVTAAAARR